jgi:hypothetical protein
MFYLAPAHAVFEKLMMPGDLIEGHARYENKCNNCHLSFRKKDQKRLCLSCHKKVAKDVAKKTGFHGKETRVHKTDCKTCHTDHKGRKADIVKMNTQTFNHRLSDFILKGKHSQVQCSACHLQGKKFREARNTCYGCHKTQDKHKGRLGKQCAKCHTEDQWNDTRFDHDKTDFRLRGKHEKVQCNECHPAQRYKNIPTQCYGCHVLNDVHRGKMGRKCQSCHSTESWKKEKFDHNKKTKFPLHFKHQSISCNACHKKDPFKNKVSSSCYSCHKLDDEHKGVLGKKCQSCHSDRNWKLVRFDHNLDTRFSLKGKHRKATCNSCHKTAKALPKKPTCYQCHQQDDAHKTKLGKDCRQCHNENGWRHKVQFDHGLTKFPLLGLHALASCESCHISTTFKKVKTECNACHAKDDSHKGKLGSDCTQCHNQNGWKIWKFNHNTQTKFELTGSHEGVDCLACHTAASIKTPPPSGCNGCHAADDRHNGRFGKRCESCHNTRTFTDITINR